MTWKYEVKRKDRGLGMTSGKRKRLRSWVFGGRRANIVRIR